MSPLALYVLRCNIPFVVQYSLLPVIRKAWSIWFVGLSLKEKSLENSHRSKYGKSI